MKTLMKALGVIIILVLGIFVVLMTLMLWLCYIIAQIDVSQQD